MRVHTRNRFGLMLAAATLSGLVAMPAGAIPAHAGPGDAPAPTTAMDRCSRDFTPDQSSTLHLAGGRGTTFPANGQQLRPGDVVRITVRSQDQVSTTGWWWQPAEGWNWVSPAGVQPRQPVTEAGYPAPGLNKHSLVGRFGSFSPFEVLDKRGCIGLGSFLTLDLRINDDQDWDNFGAWNVDVRLYRNPVLDGSFEQQHNQAVSSPWLPEGPDAKNIATVPAESNSGAKHAIISTGSRNWNALLQQIPVRPNTEYEVTGFFRTSPEVNTAFFGVRLPGVRSPKEQHFGPIPDGAYQQIRVRFNSENNTSVTLFAGFWGLGVSSLMQIDDVAVLSS